MTQQDNSPRGTLRLYGAGGAGTNIIGSWYEMDGRNAPGTALCKIAFADTSRSNLPAEVDDSKVFLLADKDGSGGVRRENHVDIGRNVPALLQQHPPGDVNVVVFSSSGGSGSVFGPLIVKELLAGGHPVVVITIGSEESAIRRQNTLNTLKSLDNIARQTGVPVVTAYFHNSPDTKRSAVDTRCRYILATLAVLASRQNRELDMADLSNWLNFPKVTAVEAQLSLLHVYNNVADVDAASNPISIASLLKDADQPHYTVMPEYSTTGFPREKIDSFDQLHFVITVDGIRTIDKMLNEKLGDAHKQVGARVKHDPIVKNTDKVTDDGLVL